MLFGLTHPAAALFEHPFSLEGARREQQTTGTVLMERFGRLLAVQIMTIETIGGGSARSMMGELF